MTAPTLIIGLGGTGCKIVSLVEEMSSENQKKNISFVAMDTDINDLKKMKASGFGGYIIQTSAKQTVEEYLKNDKEAEKEWFPVNNILDKKTVTEGAGQVRTISRLAFNTTIRNGDLANLDDAIADLYKLSVKSKEQALRVMVVSSLAGGTGSGLILPIGLYIGKHIRDKYQKSAYIPRGFFLLPEVYDAAIDSEVEKESLRCNAYAVIRELNAFMNKADGTLDKKYSDLEFIAPKVGGGGNEDYDVMPYNYCFLYDAQNKNCETLVKSLNVYLQHAAQCVYSMSVTPMEAKNNSTEDNTIKDLIHAKGNNRYCGAGSAILEYPYEDVRNYIAYNWALDSISDEWTRIDREYDDLQNKHNRLKQKGVTTKLQKRSEHYGETTKKRATGEARRAFDKMVDSECQAKEEGLPSGDYFWDDYTGNLEAYLMSEWEKKANEIVANIDGNEEVQETLQLLLSKNKINKDNMEKVNKPSLENAAKWLKVFKLKMEDASSEYSVNTSYMILDSEQGEGNIPPEYCLDRWLLDNKSETIHPNAIRYFLYHLVADFELYIEATKKKVNEIRAGWKDFEEEAFDVKSTDVKETVLNFIDENVEESAFLAANIMTKKSKRKLGDEMNQYFNNIRNYLLEETKLRVYIDTLAYINKLIKGYEHFYKSLDSSIYKLENRINDIYYKYRNLDGYAIRYVYSSPECFDKIIENNTNRNVADNLPGELRNNIHAAVKQYVKINEEKLVDESDYNKLIQNDSISYFSELFENDILAYWKYTVEQTCGNSININVLEALLKEAEDIGNCGSQKSKQDYAVEAVKQMDKLAQPFIEGPSMYQTRINSTRTYLKDIENTPGFDKEIKDSVLFVNSAPAETEQDKKDIDKYKMIFYKGMYSLKPNVFSKFAPPIDGRSIKTDGGLYFKAYYNVVDRIDPIPQETQVITPHLDKYWHLISRLPELDKDYQKVLERRIIKAFFFGLIFGYISYDAIDYEGRNKEYSINTSTNTTIRKLVVSNETPCDMFYEVKDALTVNPIVLNELLGIIDDKIDFEQCNSTKFENTILYKKLSDFKITEFNSDVRSLLEIPLLYKASCPPDIYEREPANDMFDWILDETLNYVKIYEEDVNVESKYFRLLKNQLDLMHANFDNLSKHPKCENLKNDRLRKGIYKRVCSIIGIDIKEYNLEDDAAPSKGKK